MRTAARHRSRDRGGGDLRHVGGGERRPVKLEPLDVPSYTQHSRQGKAIIFVACLSSISSRSHRTGFNMRGYVLIRLLHTNTRTATKLTPCPHAHQAGSLRLCPHAHLPGSLRTCVARPPSPAAPAGSVTTTCAAASPSTTHKRHSTPPVASCAPGSPA